VELCHTADDNEQFYFYDGNLVRGNDREEVHDSDGRTFATSMFMDDPNKVVLADNNCMYSADKGTSNHAGGLFENTTIIEMYLRVPGGNRVLADGSGRWAKPSEMGKDFGPITLDTVDSHYSHADLPANPRPYWW
ncbi:MAG: hypothetical protein HRT89_17405, partial [Lentisphaeria bacterium]|nr:hypothetical protein [Lentisphaeria bacterium]NQZ69836.1 hypothetical protein [Lentisphaeria bacterium]